MRLLGAILLVVACRPAAAVSEVVDFGSNPGALAMFEHVPSGVSGPMPLVVVLHGCAQDHGYAEQVGLVQLAERSGVALVIAEQTSANNASRCFNWYEAGDIARDRGEALSLAQMVATMKDRHDIDPSRVFVTGLSAGGAMTAVMLATYPDVFAAGAIFAGVSYRCGTGLSAAVTCMTNGSGATADAMAARVVEAASWDGPRPRLQVWAGDADTTVAPQNANDLVAQWRVVHALPEQPTASDTLGPARRDRWMVDGTSVVERLAIPGIGHGTPVDPGAGHCGTAGAFVLDEDLCASAAALTFFGIDPGVTGAEGEGEGEPLGCACASFRGGAGSGIAALLVALLSARTFARNARRWPRLGMRHQAAAVGAGQARLVG